MIAKKLAAAEKFWIAGHGDEGRASERFLKKHFPKTPIEIVDSIHAPVKFEPGIWIISPGIPRKFFETIPAENQTSGTEIFFGLLSNAERKKVIGVSGTKGKSTTVKFISELLQNAGKKAVAAGNFGVPLLEIVDDFQAGKINFVVAELSSYQLERLKTSPGIAIFLNLFPDHLDRHGTTENYFRAKSNLWQHQKPDDFLISPEPVGMHLSMMNPPGRLILSQPLEASLFAEDSVFRAPHFLQNFGTAQSLRQILKLPEAAIKKTATAFEGLPHRLEFFAEIGKQKFYDDSICTNPESAIATVQFFSGKLAAIVLGGQDRGMDFGSLGKALRMLAPRALVIVLKAETETRILQMCEAEGLNFVRVKSMAEAAEIIGKKAPTGSVVLCPGAPSYDQYKNFRERGEAWKQAVKNR
ncbi:MAG: UDP-N-acetylmuramoyl-L-alanine--D-glutamate ligase [Candidatus Gracilibacteria bacterium]|nr:UDP-N-acetylmuramoyl-L-alanine--D-glutamate ligase [Candidatus Gracilibacteria bacterium]